MAQPQASAVLRWVKILAPFSLAKGRRFHLAINRLRARQFYMHHRLDYRNHRNITRVGFNF